MSKNSSRSIDKKLNVSRVYPLPEPLPKSENLTTQIALISKNRLTNDILHDAKINKFVLEEDVLNFFPTSGDNSSGSQESWADDLEITTTKTVKAEYDLVERLLYGEEQFDVYNKEFDQWVDNFKYLRVLGSGIKLTNVRKTSEDIVETEEIIAEHKDVQDAHWLESNYLMEIKNKVKVAVISKILEDVRKRKMPVSSSHRPKWKDSRNDRRYKLASTARSEKERSSIPVRMESLNRENFNFGKQHQIIRSNISSAKWQKSSTECFDLPILSSRENKNLVKKNSARNFRTGEDKGFTLPPIGACSFRPDVAHAGFFLRSSSCNTNKRESMTNSRISLRTSSSRVVDS